MQRRTGQGATHLDPSSHSHSASLLSRWQWLPGCPLFQGSKLSLDLGQWPPTPLTPLHNQSHHETLFSQCHICIISILPEPQQLAAQSNEKSAGFCEYWYKATDWQTECRAILEQILARARSGLAQFESASVHVLRAQLGGVSCHGPGHPASSCWVCTECKAPATLEPGELDEITLLSRTRSSLANHWL